MNISISSIHSILSRKSPQKKKTGHKRKLDKADFLNINPAINERVTQTLRVTSANIVKEFQLLVSPLTVRRQLHRAKVTYKKAKQRIMLLRKGLSWMCKNM